MTFLDTVDGKLARVTVTSTRFGHYFDHIIDLVHPPIWYILWGLGKNVSQLNFGGLSRGTIFWLIVDGYIIGRLVEGIFKKMLGRFGSFLLASHRLLFQTDYRPAQSLYDFINRRLHAGFSGLGIVGGDCLDRGDQYFPSSLPCGGIQGKDGWGPLRSWFFDSSTKATRSNHWR